MSDPRVLTLTASFFHDPLAEFFWPDDELRARQLSAVVEFLLNLSCNTSSIEEAGGKNAAIVGANPPGHYPFPFFKSFASLTRLISKLLFVTPLLEMGKMTQVSRSVEKIHPHQMHWYILVLGVHPDHQGKGMGGELLRPILQKADEDGVIVYLECSNPESLEFYRKYEFEVSEKIVPVLGCPPIWGLFRNPTSNRKLCVLG